MKQQSCHKWPFFLLGAQELKRQSFETSMLDMAEMNAAAKHAPENAFPAKCMYSESVSLASVEQNAASTPWMPSASNPVKYLGCGTRGGKSISFEVGNRQDVDPLRLLLFDDPASPTTLGAECLSSTQGCSSGSGFAGPSQITRKRSLSRSHIALSRTTSAKASGKSEDGAGIPKTRRTIQ